MKKLGKFLGLLSLLFLLAACNKEGKSEGLSSDNSDNKNNNEIGRAHV